MVSSIALQQDGHWSETQDLVIMVFRRVSAGSRLKGVLLVYLNNSLVKLKTIMNRWINQTSHH